VTGLTLGLSTASPALSLALFDGDRLLAHDHRIIGRGHAEALLPGIIALLAGRRPDAIVVDTGPGSFTGIRIGIAAARALGLAWDVPVTGCEGGALVAARAFALAPGLAAVTVLMDAGRSQVLHQTVSAAFDLSAIATRTAATLGLAAAEATAGAMAPADAGDRVHDGHPDMADLMRLPAAQRGLPPAALYVRPPDAVLPL
jgi:tRNA threonylcarbamoyl adenosine modification protein YeaZ